MVGINFTRIVSGHFSVLTIFPLKFVKFISIYTFPASLCDMMPLLAIRESAIVVFPWSTWARIQRFLIFLVFSWSIFNLPSILLCNLLNIELHVVPTVALKFKTKLLISGLLYTTVQKNRSRVWILSCFYLVLDRRQDLNTAVNQIFQYSNIQWKTIY